MSEWTAKTASGAVLTRQGKNIFVTLDDKNTYYEDCKVGTFKLMSYNGAGSVRNVGWDTIPVKGRHVILVNNTGYQVTTEVTEVTVHD